MFLAGTRACQAAKALPRDKRKARARGDNGRDGTGMEQVRARRETSS